MIRWRFIAIRVFAVVLALMLVRWASAPLAEWLIVRSLQSATGAKVEIASTEVGLFPPRVRLAGVQLADPRKELRNLFAADEMLLAIDGDALLRRRFEIAGGRLTGIKVGGARTDSGRLDVVVEEAPAEAEAAGPSAMAVWVKRLTSDAEDQARKFGESLETFRTAQDIRRRWEAQYVELRERAERLEATVRELRDNARAIDNPLRDLPVLQDAIRRAEQVQKDLLVVRQRLDAMPGQVRTDMRALETARLEDQRRVAEYLPIDLPEEELKLGPELLGSLVRDQLDTVRGYLQSGRQIADITVATPEAARQRGETVLLGRPHPSWLLRRCQISGELSVDGDPFTMSGVVENLTSDRVDGQPPLHARLRLEGPRVVRIDFRRNFHPIAATSALPRDHVKIHWPRLPLPARKIGSDDEVALVIDGGTLELWVDIESQGEQIRGRFVSRQMGTRLSLEANPELADTVPVRALDRSLAMIDHVDIDAEFAGDWRQLDLQISTSLSDQLESGFRLAVDQAMLEGRQQLAAQLDDAYRQQLSELEQWLADQQTTARSLLGKVDEAVASVSNKLVAELGGADAYLGRVRGKLDRILQ
jgi:uncharacterized protein (TIGR03545 family)